MLQVKDRLLFLSYGVYCVGGHSGGTAAIGELVNNNLQPEVNNLFADDASALPTAPGLPPILTIVALAKRLAKILA